MVYFCKSRYIFKMKQKLFKITVPFFAILLCLLIIEIALSFIYGKNDTYYVWEPHLEYHFGLDDVTLRGVSKNAKSTFNSIGARSDELTANKQFKILSFGGSTTECAALDQDATWTQILQASLNAQGNGPSYWVGNFGKSGKDSNHHILHTQEMLNNKVLNDAKMALFLMGFNDLNRAIRHPEKYINNDPEILKRSAFMVVPDQHLPLYRRTAIWKFLKDIRFKRRLKKYDKEELAELYKQVRQKRIDAKKISDMPDLTEGLEHYKKNIAHLISMCRAKGIKPIFITQPVLWRPEISPESERLLYTYFPERENLTTAALFQCMRIFNEALIEETKKHNATCIDVFNASQEDWFYDDCHFNQNGAEKLATIIVENLKPLLKN